MKSTAAAAAHLAVLLLLTTFSSKKGLIGYVHSFHVHPISVSSTSSRVSPPRSISSTNNNVNTGFATTTTSTISTSSTATATTTTTKLQMGGGAAFETAASALTAALQSGPFGVAALTAVASCVVTPLTLYRQAYSFSVGYGFSVFAMGLAMVSIFGDTLTTTATASASASSSLAPLFLVSALLFYGFRLGSFLLLRELTVQSKQKQVKSFDKTPLLKRIPFSIGVSMFYAFMVTPVLYLCRCAAAAATRTTTTTTTTTNSIALAGATIAWIGALMEAVTDTQKYVAKRGKDESPDLFHGPTRGLYRISRHPNYLGEIVFWSGVLVSGAPAFGKSPIAWICSSLGFVGIYKIMIGATDRLDKKQEEKYAGQPLYDDWKKAVPKLAPTTTTTNSIVNSFLPVSLLFGGAAAAMKVVQLLAVYVK